MALLTTGPLENSPIIGIRPTKIITIKIVNRSGINTSEVVIQGFILDSSRSMYVNELFNIAPNEVLTKNYFANLDALEFVFTTGEVIEGDIGISVWGKEQSGQLVDSHRVVAWEKEEVVF